MTADTDRRADVSAADAELAATTHALMMTRYRNAHRWAHGRTRERRGAEAWYEVRKAYADDLAYPLVMHDFRDHGSEEIYRRIVLLIRARHDRSNNSR
jgi:hypothetical protein